MHKPLKTSAGMRRLNILIVFSSSSSLAPSALMYANKHNPTAKNIDAFNGDMFKLGIFNRRTLKMYNSLR